MTSGKNGSNGHANGEDKNGKKLRSRAWFDNPDNADMTALYLERYLNFGLSREELKSGKPIIGIAQTGSDLSPCNRHHIELAKRVREGIREAGGIALEFPVHPIQETGKRPTAGARPQPRLSRPRRGALRLPARRRRPHHRLRQDHARHADGRGDRQHPGDRALASARCSTAGSRASAPARAPIVWKAREMLADRRDRLPAASSSSSRPRRPRPATATRWAPPRR